MRPPIILFTYDASVYGRKIEWYLTLRNLKYQKVITEPTLPREQLQTLGIKYRRIPFLAIGRDVYCDTRLIIAKLEELFPDKRLASADPFLGGVEYVLESWINDAGPFGRTAQLIPPMALEPRFIEDRSEMMNAPFNADTLTAIRPEALAHARWFLDRVENALLGDGRPYLLGDSPGLADVHTVWTWHWLFGMLPAFEEKDIVTPDQYPRAFAWVERFTRYIDGLRGKQGGPETISSQQGYDTIFQSDFFEPGGNIDPLDPLKLEMGQLVELWPIDSGFNHHDKGSLVAIGVREVVIKSEVPSGDGHLRLHFPRINFRIRAVQDARL
jgi:glutathione S-transferase